MKQIEATSGADLRKSVSGGLWIKQTKFVDDWLAVEFIENGWNVKHLFELNVTSATYRQRAAVTSEKLERDPLNRPCSRRDIEQATTRSRSSFDLDECG